jgi:hypothetical protein
VQATEIGNAITHVSSAEGTTQRTLTSLYDGLMLSSPWVAVQLSIFARGTLPLNGMPFHEAQCNYDDFNRHKIVVYADFLSYDRTQCMKSLACESYQIEPNIRR